MDNNNQQRPDWLKNPSWRDNHIQDSSEHINSQKKTTALWISVPAFLLAYPGYQSFLDKEFPATFLILVMICAALYAWFDCFRYKKLSSILEAWCELNPFPGRIGGLVSGRIILYHHSNVNPDINISLKYKQRQKEWKETQIVKAIQSNNEWLIDFSFNVPKETTDGEKIQNADHRKDGHRYWKLVIDFKHNGKALSKEFNLPVYHLSDIT